MKCYDEECNPDTAHSVPDAEVAEQQKKNPAPPQRHEETQDCCSSSQICICCITSQPRPFGNIQASASIRLTRSSSNAISAASVFTFRWISVVILKPRTLLGANQELYNHPSTSGTRMELSGYSPGIGFWNFSRFLEFQHPDDHRHPNGSVSLKLSNLGLHWFWFLWQCNWVMRKNYPFCLNGPPATGSDVFYDASNPAASKEKKLPENTTALPSSL